jgi:uncharacterized protein YjbJ (UPF0337 family)
MGEFVDKLKGATNEAIGKAKAATGMRLYRPVLTAKGVAQETKGKAQQKMGSIKGKLGDKF